MGEYGLNPFTNELDRYGIGTVPPAIPTSFVTDDQTAIPVANILNVLGGSGIETYADPSGGDNLYIKIQNSVVDQGQTINVQTIDLSTIDCSVAGTYFFTTQLSAYSTDGTQALGGVLYTTATSDGAALTILDDTDSIAHRSAGLSGMGNTVDYEIVASGTDALLQVTGEDTFTLNWGSVTIYVFRGL